MSDYYKESNKLNYEKLQSKLLELPDFCREYFIGTEMRTSKLTQLNYARDLAIFFDYLVNRLPVLDGKTVKEVTLNDLNTLKAADVEYYLSYLSYYSYNGTEYENDEKAKARKLSAVRSFFKYFYNKDMLKENVTSKVSVPKLHEKPIIRLDNAEVKDLLDTVESDAKFGSDFKDKYNLNTRDRDIALLTLLLGTGIRVSECVGLNVKDLDLEKNSFVVTRKGGNKMTLFFSDEVKEALEVYLHTRADDIDKKIVAKKSENAVPDALFLSLQMKRMSVRAVELLVKKYAKTVTPLKKISPHKLRSTYGTALYRETKDIYIVAEVLGHKDINTTKKHYAAISEDIRKEASDKVHLRDEEEK